MIGRAIIQPLIQMAMNSKIIFKSPFGLFFKCYGLQSTLV